MATVHKVGGKIESVLPGSLADMAGICPGDFLIAINEVHVNDILAYQDALLDDIQCWSILRGTQQLEIELEAPLTMDPGVAFVDDLFDGVRRCRNHCVFCFVDQLPKGMRPTLRIKDEDYRLSFLHGNYLTLSNLSDDDLDRIDELRLSPLYVSVHATDPEIRRKLLGRKKSVCIMVRLQEFIDRDISFWAQIVVVPGFNNAEILSQSLEDLLSLAPSCLGVAVVPVGLTGHRQGLTRLISVELGEALDIIKRIEAIQKTALNTLESRFVWAADEFYRIAQRKVPSWSSYEGFPLLEDGIGMLRRFRERFSRSLARRATPSGPFLQSCIATSNAANPMFQWLKNS